MSYFPLLFLSTLALLIVNLVVNLRRIAPPGRWQYAVLLPLIAMAAFFVYRRRFMHSATAAFALEAIYYFIGFLIIVSMALLARDALRIGFWLCGSARLSGPASVRLAFAAGILAFAWSLWEAVDVRIKKIEIRTALLPPGVDRLRIAAITDLHIVGRTPIATIDNIVELANAQKPDIIAGVGDFLDDRLPPDGPQARALRKLSAPLGKFAVIGNHELFLSFSAAVDFIHGSGFRLLRGESAEAGGVIVAGVDDPYVHNRTEIADTLRKAEAPDRFVLLLSHRPEAPPETLGLFDVEISGHTHGGQIWPMRHIVKRFPNFGNNFNQGLNELAAPAGRPRARSYVYVSNGTRHWGPPVRFLTPPEITVIDLVRAEK